MIINEHLVDKHILNIPLMVENLSKVYACSKAKVVCLRNVIFSVVSVVDPLDGNVMGEK